MEKTYNKTFLASRENELVKMREDILKTIESDQDLLDSSQEDTSPQDSVDAANKDLEQTMIHTLSDMEKARVQKITAAINRIHAGNYGSCANCGKMISENRLSALPFATLCLACQELSDRDKI